jgi:hypothetical protein
MEKLYKYMSQFFLMEGLSENQIMLLKSNLLHSVTWWNIKLISA